MKDNLIIFDTTLRDGEQSPGASMTKDEKVRIARQLERLNVDVIEAGFAVASQGDFEAVQAVAREIKESVICSLSRTRPMDIERAAEAIAPAPRRRIHTFIATSPIHMAKKLRMSPEQVVEEAVNAVKLARNFTDDVEFSCEDAGRSELDFLCQIIEKVIKAGARTINIPDTVGYTMPHEYGALIKNLIEKIPNSDQAIFSVHCHNDLGLAVANSLSAVLNGARQVECTINGLGERAGNAALEEVVMAIRTRPMMFPVETRIDTTQIVATSRLVSGITGFPVQPNKAIVGANAFAHESGIHQDGVLKHRETYEIMRAEDVGWHTNRMVLGKLSGRSAVKDRLEKLGVTFETPRELDQFFKKFKDLADKKQEIFDEDLQALLSDNQAENQSQIIQEHYQLKYLNVTIDTQNKPIAHLVIHRENQYFETEGEGDGAVDASFKAIEIIAKSQAKLLLYSVNNITTGTDSQGEVTVRLSRDGRIVNGNGADTDIVIASVKAYLNALNKLGNPVHMHPQKGI